MASAATGAASAARKMSVESLGVRTKLASMKIKGASKRRARREEEEEK